MAMLGAAAGGLLGGLIGGAFGGGEEPTYRAPRTSGQLEHNLRALKRRSEMSPDAMTAGTMEGVDVAQSMIGTDADQAREAEAIGHDNDSMLRALNERSSKGYERDMNALKRQMWAESVLKKAERENKYGAVDNELKAIQQGSANAAEDAKAIQAAARNQVIVSLFSAGGSMAGAGLAQAQTAKQQNQYNQVRDSGFSGSMYGSGQMDMNRGFNQIS